MTDIERVVAAKIAMSDAAKNVAIALCEMNQAAKTRDMQRICKACAESLVVVTGVECDIEEYVESIRGGA
jgi:hypothetical protein